MLNGLYFTENQLSTGETKEEVKLEEAILQSQLRLGVQVSLLAAAIRE